MSKLPPFPESNPELLKQWNYEKNDEIDPYSITAGSSRKVWWKCKKGHEWESNLSNRARKGKGCPYCASKVSESSESFAGKYPYLLDEWHKTKNKELDPFEISVGSAKRVWWQCKSNFDHEWVSSIINRTKNDAGCPDCRSERSSLSNNYPEIIKEWMYEKNLPLTPDTVTEKSGKKVWWKCTECMNEWQSVIRNRTLLSTPCPLCSKNDAILKTKINKEKRLEESMDDYSYDIEDRLQLNLEEMHSIFKNHLKVDSDARSVGSLFSPRMLSKIDASPYYQRNYVWDKDKATYLIESLLMGTEIPPLVFYESSTGIEIIDGKQRFESIKRFQEGKISLSPRGLHNLKSIENMFFADLPDDLKEYFFDTKVRVVKYSVIDENRFSEKNQDLLKKEIFRRYNSGITPLRRVEVERAIFIDDEPTVYFKKQFKKNKALHKSFQNFFFDEFNEEKMHNDFSIEKSLQYTRFLLICSDMPIVSTRRKLLLDQFYEFYTQSVENVQPVYKDFLNKINILLRISDIGVRKDLHFNKYFFEIAYWVLSILKKEGLNLLVDTDQIENDLVQYFNEHVDSFVSDEEKFFYGSFLDRFTTASGYFSKKYQKDLSVYVSSGQKLKDFKVIQKSLAGDAEKSEYLARIERQEAIPYMIDDICTLMNREKFIVRPSYQRGEVINKAKSSAIIESILLGIKLPPLYIYKREDGIREVIDGQQRILSILGYMKQEYIDLNGNREQSTKHGYKLSNLNILSELNGVSFDDLEENMKERIWDFSLSMIVIDEKINSEFDPVDLYVRINSRPFPIKENTFEMWNSYIDKSLIEKVKMSSGKTESWFYLTKNNLRMKNEELFTILCCLDAMHSTAHKDKKYGFIDLFERIGAISVRIKNKATFTRLLNSASVDEEDGIRFLKSIKSIESFVRNTRLLLVSEDVDNVNEYLGTKLTSLFNVKGQKYYARKLQDFYALWFIMHEINSEMIRHHREEIFIEVSELLQFMKKEVESDSDTRPELFDQKVKEFKSKYSVEKRQIKLGSNEIKGLLEKQDNKCPICNCPVYFGDEIEIDHITPLGIGGSDDENNLQAVHMSCNRKKGARR